jgi:hypothetical protein
MFCPTQDITASAGSCGFQSFIATAERIKIIEVNRAAVEMREAANKEGLLFGASPSVHSSHKPIRGTQVLVLARPRFDDGSEEYVAKTQGAANGHRSAAPF